MGDKLDNLAPENILWPNGCAAVAKTDGTVDLQIQVVEGSNQHGHRDINPRNEHVYTLKQTAARIIWACACGRTLSRGKFPQ